MPLAVRQIVLSAIIGTFLVGNVLLTAALWRDRNGDALVLAADGALVAQPMLLAMWLGLARQPVQWRLAVTLTLSLIGTLAYIAGIVLTKAPLRFDMWVLFLIAGLGSTVLAGGFIRAHRFLVGVLTVDAKPGEAGDFSLERLDREPPSSRELQFGVGYILAMTGAVALVISLLRWLASFTEVQWSLVILFGWTFFVYSALAALITVTSVLAARRRRTLGLVAATYTLLAPLVAIFVIDISDKRPIGVAQFVNLYAYVFGLAATLALVAYILRRLGYRLRGGWL